jgi:hypothetical protein
VSLGVALVAASLLAASGSACGIVRFYEDDEGASATSSSSSSGTTTATSSTSTGVGPVDCDSPIGTACESGSFRSCDSVVIEGVPCCRVAKTCEDGELAWSSASCTDDCAQNCELISDPEHCDAVGWCGWFGGACRPQGYDARFVGLWLVDQPCHALYEATYYAFDAQGGLSIVDSVGLAPGEQTGLVTDCPQTTPPTFCESPLRCVFGDRWHSLGPTRLFVKGECNDGTTRAIQIGFTPEVQPVHACGGEGELLDVDGDIEWMHWGFEWSWRKCAEGTTPASCF